MTVRQQWGFVGIVVLILGGGLLAATRFLGSELFPVTVGSKAPDFHATTIDGVTQTKTLANYKGDIVLLNVWATWCVPCRTEMPALDRLQASLGGPEFAVVPISIDRGGAAKVAGFYSDIGIQNLAIYVDASGNALRDIGAVGLPTTLILDRAGREIGRIVGPAEWDDPAIVELLRRVVATPADVAMRVDKDGRANATAGPSEGGGSAARGWRWLKTLFSK